MKIYIMLPLEIIVHDDSAEPSNTDFYRGSLTLDYTIFFNKSVCKFAKAFPEKSKYKWAHLEHPQNCNSWKYTIIDPKTLNLS